MKPNRDNKGQPLRKWARMADHAAHTEDTGDGITPLHTAAFNGDLETVKKILEEKSIDVNATDKYRWTPLHDAVLNGHIEIVKLLLVAGAQLNVQDVEEAYTPLHEAARMNRKEIVQILLAAGADTSIRDADKNTALDVAQKFGFQDIVDILKTVS